MCLNLSRERWVDGRQFLIQDYPEGCANSQSGIILQTFCRKLHKIKEFGPGGVHGTPLDPPMRAHLLKARSHWASMITLEHQHQRLHHSWLINGPFTPAIFSTIAWTWTNRWVIGDTVLYGYIHTCNLVNYCMDWKVQQWVMHPFLQLGELKSSRNSSRLKNRRCELSLRLYPIFSRHF